MLAASAYGQKTIDLPEFSSVKAKKAEIDRLRQVNSTWELYAPEWSFFLSAYEGGSDFACADNLFKHVRENEKDFEDRVRRLHNLNYCEPIVDFYTNFIFTESIERDGGKNKEFYNTFVKDVNLRGDSIEDFMRQVSDDIQIFGMSYILVDAPRVPEDQPLSVADEQAQGLRPYWVLIKPEEIVHWVVDEFGTLVYVKRRQYLTELSGETVADIEKYTEFYPDRIVISRIDVTRAGKPIYLGREVIDNTLNKIPIIIARHKRSKKDPHMGLSFLRDFAYNNRQILNLTSLLDEFLYRQAFNILTKQVDANLVPNNTQDDTQLIGANNVLEYPKDAAKPEYIYPPAEPAKFIQEERQRIQQEMFRRAAQDTLNELFNGEKKSGFSQAQSFSKTVPFISSRADVLESTEIALMQLTLERKSSAWDGKIKYKDRYEITNLTDALTQLQILVRDLQLPSETFVKEELKRMVREFDGKLPVEVRVKVEKEIEEMSFPSWEKTQKEALVGKSAVSPGAQQAPKSTGTMAEVAAEAKSGQPNTAATKKVKT